MIGRLSLIFGCLVTAFSALAQDGILPASLDRNPVRLGETVRLIVELQDQNADRVEASAFGDDFALLGRSSNSRINIVNGRQSVSHQLILELEPLRSGSLVIPPIRFGPHSTAPLPIEVLEAGRTATGAREVFMEATVSPEIAWVQAPVTLSVKLFLAPSVALIDGNLSEPAPADADVERLGDDSRYQVTLDGVRYTVIERRYGLFPKASGILEIGAIQFRGEAEERSQSGLGSLFRRGRRVGAKSPALTVTVKPPDPSFSGRDWLPAHDLKITESWSEEPLDVRVGQPLTRVVQVVAEGVTALHIPEITPPSMHGARAYPDKPVLDTRRVADKLVGLYEQRIALVPTESGELVLPGLEIPWWDIQQNRERIARLEPTVLKVAAASAAPVVLPSATQQVVEVPAQAGFWPWLAAGLGILWLGTLVALLRMRGGWGSPGTRPAAAEPKVPDLTHVARACRSNNPSTARAAVVEWCRLNLPGQAIDGLDALSRQVQSAELAEAIGSLNAACYGAPAKHEFDGSRFWKLLEGELKTLGRKASETPSSALPPLYKTAP